MAIDNQGNIYSGIHDGFIVMVTPDSNETKVIAHHPESGRVYGLAMTGDDSTLYYVTHSKGLMKLDLKSRHYEFLLDEFDRKLGSLNAVAIDEANQVLYISDNGPISHDFGSKSILLGSRIGRILKFDLETRSASVLVDKLAFPNGVVYEKSTHSVIFAEFNRNRIWKYDLSTGESRILVENLLGYPDNLKLSDNGDLLVAFVLMRDPAL